MSVPVRWVIVGPGGFGREILPIVMAQAAKERDPPEVLFVADAPRIGEVNGVRVVSSDALLSGGEPGRFTVAVADYTARRLLAARFESAGWSPLEVRAASCEVLGPAEIGAGAVFCAHTIVTANVVIGRHFHANLGSYVAHDCRIGDFVTFAPGVCCNGGVVVEDEVYVGTGAVIKQATAGRPVVLGRGCVVGMGAVVTRSVEAQTTVMGNPARTRATG